MLKFEHPEILWWLILVPVLAVGFYAFLRHQRLLLGKVIGTALTEHLAPDTGTVRAWIKFSLILAAVASLILAIANPLVGTRLEEIKREGIDLFVALDVSRSMDAEDIKPSRLEKAKRDVSMLLKKLAGDRVGLIVFAGDAYVQFPLTADYAAADLFISTVDAEAVPTPGTMMASAIEQALKSFPADVPTKKAIVVVSDGENNEGDVLAAVEEARKANVRVFTIGMGTPEGGPIPIANANGDRVDFKRDRAGSIVLTKLDESTMQQIASATGGSYRRASSGGNEIDEVFKELASMEKTEFGVKQISGYESRYQFPLAFAVFLLIIEILLSERKGSLARRLKGLFPRLLMIVVCFAAMGGIASLQAQTVRGHIKEGNNSYDKSNYSEAEVAYRKALEKNAKSKEGQFNLGNAQYKQQRFEDALREYNNAALAMKDPKERSNAYYNLGNTLYRSEKLPESIEAYKQALKLNPADEDARYNLMMARNKMKQQQQQQQQQKNKKDNKDQKKNDQDKQQQQQKQDQQNKQDQQQQQQNQQNQQKQDQPQQQQQVPKKNQIPKQEAERILEALRNNEKEVQKKLQKREAVRIKVEKDW